MIVVLKISLIRAVYLSLNSVKVLGYTKTSTVFCFMLKEVLYEMRCLKSTEDMILALAGQFKQLSHEPEKFR